MNDSILSPIYKSNFDIIKWAEELILAVGAGEAEFSSVTMVRIHHISFGIRKILH